MVSNPSSSPLTGLSFTQHEAQSTRKDTLKRNYPNACASTASASYQPFHLHQSQLKATFPPTQYPGIVSKNQAFRKTPASPHCFLEHHEPVTATRAPCYQPCTAAATLWLMKARALGTPAAPFCPPSTAHSTPQCRNGVFSSLKFTGGKAAPELSPGEHRAAPRFPKHHCKHYT